MIREFRKQIASKNLFVASVKKDRLEIIKQGINEYLVFFKSQNKQNNWCISCSINAIVIILRTWETDKKLIKKYHSFEW